MMKVWIVGLEPLDQGSEASAYPAAAFSSEAAAYEYGRKECAYKVGKSYWWGTLDDVDDAFEVWEFVVDEEA